MRSVSWRNSPSLYLCALKAANFLTLGSALNVSTCYLYPGCDLNDEAPISSSLVQVILRTSFNLWNTFELIIHDNVNMEGEQRRGFYME